MKVLRWLPKKHAQTIRNALFPFHLEFIYSFFHFSSGVQKIHTWKGSDDFSILHSLLQTTPLKSSVVQLRLSSTQPSRAAACLCFNNGCFSALHFLISTTLNTLSTVDTASSGQFMLHNSQCLMLLLLLVAWTNYFFARRFSISNRLERKRLFWFPHSGAFFQNLLTVLHRVPIILANIDMTPEV